VELHQFKESIYQKHRNKIKVSISTAKSDVIDVDFTAGIGSSFVILMNGRIFNSDLSRL